MGAGAEEETKDDSGPVTISVPLLNKDPPNSEEPEATDEEVKG